MLKLGTGACLYPLRNSIGQASTTPVVPHHSFYPSSHISFPLTKLRLISHRRWHSPGLIQGKCYISLTRLHHSPIATDNGWIYDDWPHSNIGT